MDIVDYPALHLSKMSQPDANWRLEEPSWMRSDAIDCWLNHWLKLQKLGKHPLVLKDGSGNLSDQPPDMTTKWEGKWKAQYIEMEGTDMSDKAEMLVNAHQDSDHEAQGNELSDQSDKGLRDLDKGEVNAENEGKDLPERQVRPSGIYPLSPKSAALSCRTQCTFLKSLSNDKSYHMLQLLLNVAKVGTSFYLITVANLHCRMVIN